ncbi:cation diffusion facilitator family transporter [Echinicola jeungdonensis]|uniref:Cation diffusion facilitator family transporter n=1 Tax=Echinicola jeungdonensis TaxID=709343 RepID=A0ABV5J7D2_9BACT|nr:cation diffusion facilitator family transporter [Echinicola jeungdonensis]MDN3670950.1 cation diffusion facilitator family transporter [Echinicola jeungdonensis]
MSEHHHPKKNIQLAFFLNLGFTILEFIGGFYTNSIAIISDALHDLGDSISLGISWYLARKSTQKATSTFTFGFKRFSLLGALINSLILIVGGVFIIKEAIQRLITPEFSDAKGMLIFALIGVAVNGYAAYKLSHGKTLNEKVVSWHLLEDVLGWVAVLLGALVLLIVKTPYVDPALSLGISLFILWNVFKRLKDTIYVFLQASPKEINEEEIMEELQKIPHVESLHHIHIWSLDGEKHVFTAHIKLKHIQQLKEVIDVKNSVKKVLKGYPFSHHTIEVELPEEICPLDPEMENSNKNY